MYYAMLLTMEAGGQGSDAERSEYFPMFNCQQTGVVYDGVREIRRAVLMNRGEEEIDTDTE